MTYTSETRPETSCINQANNPDPVISLGGYPVLGTDIVWATDLMVLRVKKIAITQLIGQVSNCTFGPPATIYSPLNPPKYLTPTAQLDQTALIEPENITYCENGY